MILSILRHLWMLIRTPERPIEQKFDTLDRRIIAVAREAENMVRKEPPRHER